MSFFQLYPQVQRISAERLRYVTLDLITEAELADNKPNPLLFECSSKGRFGEIDAFISHSWSDPSDGKWSALQRWREEFKSRHGREPRVWFDKCCIDQGKLTDSLLCLPVHLAACRKILVLAGPTYVTRMWCVLELFVFLVAVCDLSRIEGVAIQAEKKGTAAVRRSINFLFSSNDDVVLAAVFGAWREVVERKKAELAVLHSFRAFAA